MKDLKRNKYSTHPEFINYLKIIRGRKCDKYDNFNQEIYSYLQENIVGNNDLHPKFKNVNYANDEKMKHSYNLGLLNERLTHERKSRSLSCTLRKNKQNFNSPSRIIFYKYLNFLRMNYTKAIELCSNREKCMAFQNQILANLGYTKSVYVYIDHLRTYLKDICKMKYGNYLGQLLVRFSSWYDLNEILNIIMPYFSEIILNHYGTRFLQSIINKITSKDHKNIIKYAIKENILDYMNHKYAKHTIITFFNRFPEELENPNFVLPEILQYFDRICLNRNGNYVIQNILSLFKAKLATVGYFILYNAFTLIRDIYGRYIIKAILLNQYTDKIWNDIKFQLVTFIIENIFILSTDKFSSQVVEEMIYQHSIICFNINLVSLAILQNNLVMYLICDEFGNYVIQAVLKVGSGYTISILNVIGINLDYILSNTKFGFQLIKKLLTKYDHLQQYVKISKFKNFFKRRSLC